MGSSRSPTEQFRAFFELPTADRMFLLIAWLTLFGIEWRLRTRSLLRIWTACEDRMTKGSRLLALWVPSWDERAAWLLEVADRYHPLRSRCLRTSLTLAWLLAADRRQTTLHIGVHHPPGGLEAHAWLEADGRPITEIPADVEYMILEPVRKSR